MEQPNSENIGLQLRNALFGAPGEPVNQGAVGFGRRIFPMLGITSFSQDATSAAEPKLLGTTAMTETRPDETTLSGRAAARTQYEATKQQQNLEAISSGAGPYIKEDAKADEVEEDWLANFFDRGRLVSDKEMQKLWSHILASEVNQPGTFSIRTLNLLASLSKSEAIIFRKLCSYMWTDDDPMSDEHSVIILLNRMIRDKKNYGLSIKTLYDLQDIGLINYLANDELEYSMKSTENTSLVFEYHGNKFELRSINPDGSISIEVRALGVGQVKLSHSGEELSKICNPEPDFGYMDIIVKSWEKQNISITTL